MKLNYIYSSRTGLRRSINEDYVDVFEVEDGLLAIVCDGLGGNKAGEVASKLAVSSIYNSFLGSNSQDYQARIHDSIRFANQQLITASANNSEYKGMATTSVVLFINKNLAYWGHVGDSRLYYYNKNQIIQVTKDHSFVQKLLDDGYISVKDAEHHPHKNVIMRALGDKLNLEIDTDVIKFHKNESWKFLLCTDGVSNVLTKPELAQHLSQDNLEYISKSFSQIIEERGAPDNYSFIIISNQI